MKVTKFEKNNYVLNNEKNLKILEIIKKIEKHKLTNKDKETIELAKTQLKKDWQTPLINHLNKLLIKYKK